MAMAPGPHGCVALPCAGVVYLCIASQPFSSQRHLAAGTVLKGGCAVCLAALGPSFCWGKLEDKWKEKLHPLPVLLWIFPCK